MAKVVQDVEPICFEDAIGHALWDKTMDEEMATLDANRHGSWCLCLKGKRLLDVSGCTK
jgi:hypothetical protein